MTHLDVARAQPGAGALVGREEALAGRRERVGRGLELLHRGGVERHWESQKCFSASFQIAAWRDFAGDEDSHEDGQGTPPMSCVDEQCAARCGGPRGANAVKPEDDFSSPDPTVIIQVTSRRPRPARLRAPTTWSASAPCALVRRSSIDAHPRGNESNRDRTTNDEKRFHPRLEP